MMKLFLSVSMFLGITFNGFSQATPLPFSNYIEIRGGLNNAYHAFSVDKKATVAFLGGSITFNPGWRDSVCTYLKVKFPQNKFHFISAGIPSLGSLPHAFRLKNDILDSGKVDLLFLEAAVNDSENGTDSLTQVRTLEGIVRHAKTSNPSIDIIMMSFADTNKTRSYNNGLVPVTVGNHELIAAHYNLPSINLAKAVRDKIENKEFSWDNDFKDLHPAPFGQMLYFNGIKTLLSETLEPSAGGLFKKRKAKLPLPLDKWNFSNGSYFNIQHANYNKDWKLNKNWTPADHLSTRPGFVNVPMLVAETPGASLTLTFKGTAIGMAIVSGADAGIVTYSIDNSPEQQIDLFTKWSSYLHLPWYVIFDGRLKDTSHILKLTISSEKNKNSTGTACRIVNFLVNK